MNPRTTFAVALLFLVANGMGAAKGIERDSRYPAHWWKAVPRQEAASWEILPQDAGPDEVILSKRNELGLLSNFANTPFRLRGKQYASLEGFWQMMKHPEGPDDPRAKFVGLEWPYTREQVAEMSGFEARKAGTLAGKNIEKMGIGLVTFEGKRMEYRPKVPGEHYRLIVEATREKGSSKPQSEESLAGHRRSGVET